MFEKMEKWINKLTHKNTKFVGYEQLKTDAIVLALFNDDGEETNQLKNEKGFVIFDTTPFYALGGGQESDNGFLIKNDGTKISMEDVRKDIIDGYHIHLVDLENNEIKIGEKLTLIVNEDKRTMSSINHSALHTTWQTILNFAGHYIGEVGSKLNEDKYQLQFKPDDALNENLILEVTKYLNDNIYSKDIKSNIFYVDQKTAKEKEYLFEFTKLKENEEVRMVEFPGFTIEPCGGTHVDSTINIAKTFFLYFDKNKERVLIDMTANYNFAKQYFNEKIDNKVEEILTIVSKIRDINSEYKNNEEDWLKTLINNDELWNYITIQNLNETYKQITKDYNIAQKEQQKILSEKLDSMEIENNELEFKDYKIKSFNLSDGEMVDKILVPKTMKLSKENVDFDLITMINKTKENNLLIIVSNNKEINLSLLAEKNSLNEKLNLKGGGNPKLLVLTSEENINLTKIFEVLFK